MVLNEKIISSSEQTDVGSHSVDLYAGKSSTSSEKTASPLCAAHGGSGKEKPFSRTGSGRAALKLQMQNCCINVWRVKRVGHNRKEAEEFR